MSNERDIKRLETLKKTLHKYRKTGPIQTSLGSQEQGLTLPFIEIAALIDLAERGLQAEELVTAAKEVSAAVEGARARPTPFSATVSKATQKLEAVLETMDVGSSAVGRTLEGLIEGKREDLLEATRNLIEAMSGEDQWLIKNSAGLVEMNLESLRSMVVQAPGTKVEGWWKEAQELVNALRDGPPDRAVYHAGHLEGVFEAAGLNSPALTLSTM